MLCSQYAHCTSHRLSHSHTLCPRTASLCLQLTDTARRARSSAPASRASCALQGSPDGCPWPATAHTQRKYTTRHRHGYTACRHLGMRTAQLARHHRNLVRDRAQAHLHFASSKAGLQHVGPEQPKQKQGHLRAQQLCLLCSPCGRRLAGIALHITTSCTSDDHAHHQEEPPRARRHKAGQLDCSRQPNQVVVVRGHASQVEVTTTVHQSAAVAIHRSRNRRKRGVCKDVQSAGQCQAGPRCRAAVCSE